MLRDIKFSLRVFAKDRGYATTVILTLAVCIGANTAIFTIVNSVLLRPLPVPESDQILLISNQYPRAGVSEALMMESGVPDYYDRLRDLKAFGEQALYDGANETIESNGTPQRVHGLEVTLTKLDRGLPLSNVMTMTERVNRSLMPRRAAMVLSMAFAWIALFLSAIGIYGVLVYLVAQRTREIGIRMALGGTPRGIFNLVLREGMFLVAGGLFLGVFLALAVRRFLESQLSGISFSDPVVIGGAVVVIGGIALVACAVPARKATRVDPATVLNQ